MVGLFRTNDFDLTDVVTERAAFDIDDSHTYSVVTDAGSPQEQAVSALFEFAIINGRQWLKLKDDASLDYEADYMIQTGSHHGFYLTIRTTDSSGKTFETNFFIKVDDVDENSSSRIFDTLDSEDIDSPFIETHDNPLNIDFTDWDVPIEGLLSVSIVLPQTAIELEEADTDLTDLERELDDLMGGQIDSKEFDFDNLNADLPLITSVVPVKPKYFDSK